jgi:hypothetical protein
MKRTLLLVVGPACGAVAVLAGLLLFGRWAWEDLSGRERYQVPFADIECSPPEGLSRADFLDEVRYLEGLPAELPLLEPGLSERLAHAFASHPWVEKVVRVEITPPRHIRVSLRYRTPALAVALAPGEEGPRRAVDRHGVLLPVTGREEALPLLVGVSAPEAGPGNLWGDERVESAAVTVGFLGEGLARLGLDGCGVEVKGGEVVLHKGEVRILWGHPPGREGADEPRAKAKLRRLWEMHEKADGLAGEVDVRSVTMGP